MDRFWVAFILAFAAAVSLLAASLYRTIPGLVKLSQCIQGATDVDKIVARAAAQAAAGSDARGIAALAQRGPQACLGAFWGAYQIPFVLTLLGGACLAVALATCCCFCCADAPEKRRQADEFVAVAVPDAGGYGGDQYAYYAPPPPALPPYKGGGPGAPRAFH
ncbi:MAG: hypothetical protein J3K34DRAFT_518149 [Monoraphidium minutum]|nr:MAG: hypothetical protein J3K34DRAFT_518149 [Monoraphidium minutum]